MRYSKRITLKDGRPCTMRNGTEQDGKAALDNFVLAHRQTDYLLSEPNRMGRLLWTILFWRIDRRTTSFPIRMNRIKRLNRKHSF